MWFSTVCFHLRKSHLVKPSNKSTDSSVNTDIAIAGGGLVGLTASLAALKRGHSVTLIAPDIEEPDGRTSALLAETVIYLKSLGLWSALAENAYPLKIMRIVDGTKRLFRAPQTDFIASEIGLSEFGFNLENRFMAQVLNEALGREKRFRRISAKVTDIEFDQPFNENAMVRQIETDIGEKISAKLIFASDGRNSVIRKRLDISERKWDYPQIALVGNFSHTLPHNDTSTEFHTETGPCTIVPLGKNRSSLVYVVDRPLAEQILALDMDRLNLALEQRMASVPGKITMDGPLKSFLLSSMLAERFSKSNCLLGGEAGHVFPPIGAQGLNLGLRDVAVFDQLVSQVALDQYGEIAKLYQEMRERDVSTRTYSVDVLNRSLLSDFLPVQMTRSLGLYALGSFGPLRQAMMRKGTSPNDGRISGL